MLRYVRRSDAATAFERPDDMPEALHALLCARGIASAREAEAFLYPGPGSLHDPMRLHDMPRAAARLRAAIDAGERVCVYGDYDVDGVSAAAILSEALKGLGLEARVYLPSRHSEGYGLNEAAVRALAAETDLMVTVDCGVTSVELVALARALGMDVIVTDHHEPGEALPDCPVVNPLLGDYPYPSLCGAGVAWKLVQALTGGDAMEWVDIAALATVADVVPLTGENRAIVRMGLEAINRAPRIGVAALIEAAGLSERRIDASSVAFQLAPRLNAGGRLGSATRALELLTASDARRARALAMELNDENSARKAVEQQILAEAEAQLAGFDFPAHRALILAGAGWNPGVIGLAASRLVEKYHYPVILLADQGEKMTGSCRSIEGVDIHAALVGCARYLERFGGHRQAAGLTLLPEELEGFRRAMDEWIGAHVDPFAFVPTQPYDTFIPFEALTPGLVAGLEALQPTGFGNPGATFRAACDVVDARRVGADGAHLRLLLSQPSHRLFAIGFRMGPLAEKLAGGVDALFVPRLNSYMGRTSVELELRALRGADVFAGIDAKVGEESDLQCDFLTEVFYNKKTNCYAGTVAEVDAASVRALMLAAPQGALAICADLGAAEALLRAVQPAEPDVFYGELPEDPRRFNSVCVCPPPGDLRGGWRHIILAGVPEAVLPAEAGGEVLRLETPAGPDFLPDLDALRAAYLALMRIAQRPVHCANLRQLSHLVGEEAALSRVAAHASILTMLDLGLFELDFAPTPARIHRVGPRRVDPRDSAFWSLLQGWRTNQREVADV